MGKETTCTLSSKKSDYVTSFATVDNGQARGKGRWAQDEKKVAGPAVHYAFGSTMGALYGIAAELTPRSSAAWGLPFGAALWFGADEVAIPALGLSGESQPKISTHASALAAHLVYGLTTDSVRRVVRKALK
jgi:hypothetical protein